ncbi:Retrovirus-related Pol polyprotein from transposon TNT 1-94 [Cucumis melo var. makuwa]|uniref:Retrovirus-related Pol polyprotein from transposon TNT 1-94 n=1 Tax=Cucumis melo var. makuwa TaxID=1194695 RepID=A0A5A7TFR5_CUCMM|nr:Retrovirus-related Pol polyprotein from transposon TNT 1-94 [Cucumis melo var. makuwa]
MPELENSRLLPPQTMNEAQTQTQTTPNFWDKPVNIVVGSQIWVGDIDSVWIDGLVLNITGEDAEIQTSDGRQNLQKPPIYPTGVVPQPYAPPSDQKMIHAPLVSGAWAHALPPFHVTAHPVPFYASLDVQPSNPSGHSHPHAPPMSSGQQPSTVNLSNQYRKQQLYVDSLQQPLFSGNGIDQPQNRSDIEAGESSTHSKPTELPIYSKNLVTTSSGKRWFVTFIDDHTRLTWVYLITDKSEVPSIFQNFYHTIKTQFHTKIAILRSDNGREFQNHNLSEFLASKGIVHQTSCAYTPQQNGVAERKNRHLVEVARSLMLSTSLPSYLWGDAILTAAHLINRMPSRILHLQTPLDCLKESYPSTRLVSEACVFVGYPLHQRGYKCFHPPSRKYFVTMDVTFCENRPYFPVSHLQGENVSEESNNTFEFVEPTPITVSDIDPHPIILPTNQVPWKTYYRRNLRKEVGFPTSQPPAPVQNFEPPRDQGMENPTKPCTNNTMSENDKSDVAILENMEEKNRDDETEVRIETSNDEAEQGHTRKLDEYDPSFDIPIALRKGTKSCTKHPICNYVSYDNLSPQFRALTASLDSTIIPKNIYTALECPEWKNAVMEEMKALEKNRTWEICALPKGHKTVGCKWVFSLKYKADGTLDRHKARLVAKGFTQTYGIDYSETFSPVAKLNTVRVLLSVAVNKDWPLYQLDVKNAFLNGDLMEEVYMSPPPGFEAQFGQQASKTGKIAILIVYVDDIVLTGDDQTEISQLKQRMGDEFEIKDLGNLKYFLGMEVARSKEGISVSQRKYTLDLLTETGMLGCRPADTPIEFNCKLGNSDDQVPIDKEQYQRLVGKLIYLSHTRPDISFAVSVVSQFMQAPYEKHMEAVNKILRYLKNTPGKGLMFRKTNRKTIEAYTDSDWAGSVIDRKSTSGYCTFVWGNLVTWRSKKQSVVAKSSAEAEYRAMSLGISAISIANNPVQHDRTKHVEIDRHFIKERLDSGSICIPYIPSSQ